MCAEIGGDEHVGNAADVPVRDDRAAERAIRVAQRVRHRHEPSARTRFLGGGPDIGCSRDHAAGYSRLSAAVRRVAAQRRSTSLLLTSVPIRSGTVDCTTMPLASASSRPRLMADSATVRSRQAARLNFAGSVAHMAARMRSVWSSCENLPADLILETAGLIVHLGADADFRFAALGVQGAERGEPGDRHQAERRQQDRGGADDCPRAAVGLDAIGWRSNGLVSVVRRDGAWLWLLPPCLACSGLR